MRAGCGWPSCRTAARQPLNGLATLALAYGVILRVLRNSVAVCPPLIITEAEIEELLDGLRRALDDGLAHAREKGWM